MFKEPTCFKNPDNPILTNRKQYLQSTTVIETIISDNIKVKQIFNLKSIDSEFIAIEISKPNSAKTCPLNNIPAKL